MRTVILAIALFMSACGTDTAPPDNKSSCLDECGVEPSSPDDYPTIDAWRDEALLWMTCARHACGASCTSSVNGVCQ